MSLTRRDFLKGAFAVVSVGTTVPTLFTRAVHASALESVGGAPATSANGKILVLVQMSGGNDGLNSVIPYRNPIYRDARRVLGVPEEAMLPLDDTLALHPRLAPFHQLWRSGKMAIIDGVGYPNPNRSHFRAMEIWQGADPVGLPRDGWLGRYLEQFVSDKGRVLHGVNIGGVLPRTLLTEHPVPSVADVNIYRIMAPPGIAGDARTNALLRIHTAYAEEAAAKRAAPYGALFDLTATDAYRSSMAIQAAARAYRPMAQYPERSGFANGLRTIAQIIDADMGARVCHITIGGWDTHVNQQATHERLLGDLSEGLAAFWADIEAHGHGDKVLVVTWSEFGRRLRENGANGTDHGAPGPMFAIGNGVRPGLYGAPMDLSVLNDGDPLFTTDFRSVYTTILEGWLGADARALLGAPYPQVPFLRT